MNEILFNQFSQRNQLRQKIARKFDALSSHPRFEEIVDNIVKEEEEEFLRIKLLELNEIKCHVLDNKEEEDDTNIRRIKKCFGIQLSEK